MEIIKCHDCMPNAPYVFCCKTSCGTREQCKDCHLDIRGDNCPNDSKYVPEETHKLPLKNKESV